MVRLCMRQKLGGRLLAVVVLGYTLFMIYIANNWWSAVTRAASNKKGVFYEIISISGLYNITHRDEVERAPYEAIKTSTKSTPIIVSLVPLSVKEFQDEVVLFSAIVGNSTKNTTWDRIVIQGFEPSSYKVYIYSCCVLYQSGAIERVKMSRRTSWLLEGNTQIKVRQFICPNVRDSTRDLPAGITLSSNSSKKECHINHSEYLGVSFAYRHEHELAVCTKVAFGRLDALGMLTWYEVHKPLGIDKVLVFINDDLNSAARAVLKYYESEGIVEVIPFVLPETNYSWPEPGAQDYREWTKKQVTVFDCLERLKGYKYILLFDYDEFLIPKRDNNLKELFDRYFSEHPKAAGFSFWTKVLVTTLNVTNHESKLTAGRYVNSTEPIAERQKNVVRPDKLAPGGLDTHSFNGAPGFRQARYMKAEDIVIHHFRSCKAPPKMFSCRAPSRHIDTTVADQLKTVEEKILYLNETIFSTL